MTKQSLINSMQCCLAYFDDLLQELRALLDPNFPLSGESFPAHCHHGIQCKIQITNLKRYPSGRKRRQAGSLLEKKQCTYNHNYHIKCRHVPLHILHTTCVIASCWFQKEMLYSACFACLHFHPRLRLPCAKSARSPNINKACSMNIGNHLRDLKSVNVL